MKRDINSQLTERQICDCLFEWEREGVSRFHSGAHNPHHPESIQGFMDMTGWVIEDLRCALMRADIGYCIKQAAYAYPEWGSAEQAALRAQDKETTGE